MTQLSPEALAGLVEKVRELLPKVTPGEWETDSAETEDGDGKYYTQEITGAYGKVVCEFSNADAEIHIEYDEDGATRWDNTAKNNAALIALAPTMAAAILALEAERDQAIAHDRQPYPTAEAYELVCKARTKWQERAERVELTPLEISVLHNIARNLDFEGYEISAKELRAILDRIASLARSLTAPVEKEKE